MVIDMVIVEFNEKRCKTCGLCADACPLGIIYVNTDRVMVNGRGCAELKENKCIGCKSCVTVCPDAAISLRRTDEDK